MNRHVTATDRTIMYWVTGGALDLMVPNLLRSTTKKMATG